MTLATTQMISSRRPCRGSARIPAAAGLDAGSSAIRPRTSICPLM